MKLKFSIYPHELFLLFRMTKWRAIQRFWFCDFCCFLATKFLHQLFYCIKEECILIRLNYIKTSKNLFIKPIKTNEMRQLCIFESGNDQYTLEMYFSVDWFMGLWSSYLIMI